MENYNHVKQLLPQGYQDTGDTTSSFNLEQGAWGRGAFFTLPYSVNYAALSIKGVPYVHKDSARLSVLAKFIEQKYIHPEIREKGGAYGGGARYSPIDGILSFTSYRDPSFERSLKIMQDAGQWVMDQNIDDEMLGEMKLSIFKDLDSPISVQQEGMMYFLNGITEKMQQTYSITIDLADGLDGGTER